MVWRYDAVVYSILFQQCSEVRVVEMWALVDDDGPWTSVSSEDALCDESQNLPMIICSSGDCLNQLGHIVHRH